jgi:hypothetical protein
VERDTLPSRQHLYQGQSPLSEQALYRRRETTFLVFAGLFVGTLAMLNVLGITRFVVLGSYTPPTDDAGGGWAWGQWGAISFAVAVGVLPYPITFLCTDFISELFGRARAARVVWIGLLVNVWVIAILWLAGALPVQAEFVSYGVDAAGREVMAPPLPQPVYTDDGTFQRFDEDWTFYRVQMLAFGAVAASMIAYLLAQLVDVHVFHFWKKLTKGRHLWLRNNGSTLVSQLVDTTAVILITHFYARALPIDADSPLTRQLLLFIATGYAFKVVSTAIDTVPFYLGSRWLRRYLRLPPATEHEGQPTGAAAEAGVG